MSDHHSISMPTSASATTLVGSMPKATRFLVMWLPFTYFVCLLGGGSSGSPSPTTAGHVADGAGTGGNLGATFTSGTSPFLLRYFALVPANTFLVHTYPWTFFTHVLVENNGVLLAISVASLLTMGKKLEEDWGTRKYCILIMLAALTSSVAIVINTSLAYGLFGSMSLFEYFAGFLPCCMALVVGYWQRCPDEPLPLLAAVGGGSTANTQAADSGSAASGSNLGTSVTLRVRHLPFLCFILLLVYEFLFGPATLSEVDIVPGADELFPGSDTYPALCALWWTWFALRFCSPSVRSLSIDSGLCGLGYAGDPNPSFALHMSIPLIPLQSIVEHTLCAIGFKLLLLVGLGSAVQDHDPSKTMQQTQQQTQQQTSQSHGVVVRNQSSPSAAPGRSTASPSAVSPTTAVPPSAAVTEADRRRKIAMEALQSRLSEKKTQNTGPAQRPASPSAVPANSRTNGTTGIV